MKEHSPQSHYQAIPAQTFDLAEGIDSLLVITAVALLALGAIMVFSATVAADSSSLAFNSGPFLRHLVHIGLGSALLLMAMYIPLDWLQISSKAILLIGLLLLALLFVPGVGREVNGSLRWFELGGFRMQPSEFMKIAALVYFADYLARKKEDLHLFKVGIINVGLVTEPSVCFSCCSRILAPPRYWLRPLPA